MELTYIVSVLEVDEATIAKLLRGKSRRKKRGGGRSAKGTSEKEEKQFTVALRDGVRDRQSSNLFEFWDVLWQDVGVEVNLQSALCLLGSSIVVASSVCFGTVREMQVGFMFLCLPGLKHGSQDLSSLTPSLPSSLNS